MEEGEAAAVRLQAPPQVVPAVDRMHGLVLDDLLEQPRRRRPVDLLHLEEARVEPRGQQVQQVGLDGREFWMVSKRLQQRPAYLHDGRGPARRAVQPSQQFLAGRLRDHVQTHQMLGRRRRCVALGRRQHRGRVRVEAGCQFLEETQVGGLGQSPIVLDRLRRQTRAVRLALGRQQMAARAHQGIQLALRDHALRGVADRVEQGHDFFRKRVK